MKRIILKLFILFSCASLSSCGSRKYNVEEECMKLYGEDLHTVLARFRRTPEYLKILEDKRTDLMSSTYTMLRQVIFRQASITNQRVDEMFPTSTTAANANDHEQTIPDYHMVKVKRRQQDEEPTEDVHTTMDPVELSKKYVKALDDYWVFHSSLTVQERNSAKDLGFEMAGQAIHTGIQSMGKEGGKGETDVLSTKMAGGGGGEPDTDETTHPFEHRVRHTTEGSERIVNNEPSEPTQPIDPEILRKKYVKNVKKVPIYLADIMNSIKEKPNRRFFHF